MEIRWTPPPPIDCLHGVFLNEIKTLQGFPVLGVQPLHRLIHQKFTLGTPTPPQQEVTPESHRILLGERSVIPKGI